MSVKKLLNEEVEKQIGSLEDIPFGSKEYHQAVQDTSILLDKLNDMEKIDREYQEKAECRQKDEDIKRAEIREGKIERVVKYGLTAATFMISLGVTIWANKDSKNFEMGYTHTTESGKGSTRKLLNLMDKFK